MTLKALNGFAIVEPITENKSSTGMIMGSTNSEVIKGKIITVAENDKANVGDTVYFHKGASASLPDGNISVKVEHLVAIEVKE